MTGTILENLSNRKLFYVISIIFIIQIISFLIGAFVAPSPSNTEQLVGIRCLADDKDQLSIPRQSIIKGRIKPKNCREHRFDNETRESTVFAFQLPLPRENVILDYSRWMSNLIGIIMPEMVYSSNLVSHKPVVGDDIINGTVSLNVRLGVRNKGEKEWKEYAKKDGLKRKIFCRIAENKRRDDNAYDCDMIQLFELQSLYYDYYVINLEFGQELNHEEHNGIISEIHFVAIHQNGGFTKVWLSLKTVFTVLTLFTLVWYLKRLFQLGREKTLLEKMILLLGVAITQLNIPLEYLTLWLDIPFMNFFSDIRQGILYCTLLSFWIIFAGEHLLDGVRRSRISSYYKQLSVVLVASIALFVFDSTERGVQWIDPFFTIWEVESYLAVVFITTASISAAIYFIFLSYHILLVFRNISSKQTSLPSMSSTRRMIYQGIIYRFKFLLVSTLVCAACTIVAYILGQVRDEVHQWDDDSDSYSMPLQWTSAMFTTVYAMWNCYIITLLILYAPSHKNMNLQSNVDAMSEEIEFNRLNTDDKDLSPDAVEESDLNTKQAAGSSKLADKSDMRLLQEFAAKQNID